MNVYFLMSRGMKPSLRMTTRSSPTSVFCPEQLTLIWTVYKILKFDNGSGFNYSFICILDFKNKGHGSHYLRNNGPCGQCDIGCCLIMMKNVFSELSYVFSYIQLKTLLFFTYKIFFCFFLKPKSQPQPL